VRPWLAVLLSADLLLPKFYLLIDPIDVAFGLYFGFTTAQVTLHAGWTIFGPGSLLLRIISIPLAMIVMLWFWHGIDHDGERLVLQLAFACQWLLVATAGLFLVGVGFRLVSKQGDPEPQSNSNRQYSLRHLVALLTVASILAAFANRVENLGSRIMDPLCWLTAATMSFVTFPTIPSVLIARHFVTAVCSCLVIPCILTFLLPALLGPIDAVLMWLLFGASLGLSIAILATLRRDGFRLRRIRDPAAASHLNVRPGSPAAPLQ
jgi:hypothetical protein